MVSVDCMLISILSVSVKALDMSCAVAAEARFLVSNKVQQQIYLSNSRPPGLPCKDLDPYAFPQWPYLERWW